jgi:hypothetical protein
MSLPSWVKGGMPLGSEGHLYTFMEGHTEPSETMADQLPLACLTHGPLCNGQVDVVKITPLKQVLFCKKCGLRRVIPPTIKCIGELRALLQPSES